MDTKILRKGFGTAAGISAQLAAYHQACNDAANEIDRLRSRIESAPEAIMDTRAALGICAPTEEDFPALYALQGKRVRLVVDEMHNAELERGAEIYVIGMDKPERIEGQPWDGGIQRLAWVRDGKHLRGLIAQRPWSAGFDSKPKERLRWHHK